VTYFKRPILPLLAAWALGLVAGYEWHLPLFVLLLAGAAAGLWALWRREATPLILAATAAGGFFVAQSLIREQSVADRLLQSLAPPVSVTLRGTVDSVDTPDELRPRFVVSPPSLESQTATLGFPGCILVTVNARDMHTTSVPTPGEVVEVSGTLDEPRTCTNFFGADYRQRLARQGIYATLRASAVRVVAPASLASRLTASLASVRHYATSALQHYLPADESRWVTSMLFNDYRLLTPREMASLRDSNLLHIFAVSGMHVAALAAIVLILLRACSLSWRTAWLAAVAITWAYVSLTGFVPSAQRAATMLTAYAASMWLRREIDALSALAAGCFVLILWHPLYLWEPGFILSATGVLAIFSLFPLLKKALPDPLWVDRLPAALRTPASLLLDGLRLALGVAIFLLPIQLYYFQQINIFAIIANAFGDALAGPIVGAGMATIAFGSVSSELGVLLGNATAFLMECLMGIVNVTAAQDWAIIHTPQLHPATVFAYYAILVGGYYFVRRDTPEFAAKARARLAIHVCAALLIVMVVAAWQRADRRLKVWFFDVGQGDSALIQLPTGQSILVDAGNSIPDMAHIVVEPQLRALGCWPLDYLVVTHEDSDHSGGVPTLIGEWAVRTLVVSPDIVALDRLSPATPSRSSFPEVVRVCAGYRVPVGPDLELRVLNPDCAASAGSASENDRSLVIFMRYREFSLLMTGDAGQAAERAMIGQGLTRCDVLKVAHHGSAFSSSEAFLQAVNPQIAIISCGRHNRYGHPAPAVLERLAHRGTAVYRTDRDGAILVATDGQRIEVRSAASQRRTPHFALE
jgi:competence protein ComEC